MLKWSQGSLDQPPPKDKEMSLMVGHLAAFYYHNKLCNEMVKGPKNIFEMVVATKR